MNTDYQRIAQAIAYVESHVDNQPTLSEVAACVHLSPYHFQRLFRRWAGVSPKRFLQYLTVEHAKGMLAQSQSILEISATLGLSSSSRLHDQFVTLEGMSPGVYKSGGKGLDLHYGRYPSPFGEILLVSSPGGICHLSFLDTRGVSSQLAGLKQRWPQARWFAACEQPTSELAQIAANLFCLNHEPQQLRIAVTGSNLQIQVWKALLRIPVASVISYGDIARDIGRPRAARSVGTAIAANPVAWLIPCHRVLRRTGGFGQYHWGTERKKLMVAWEFAQTRVAE
ncbi:MAG TPA: methylated-DNA--[protein]-cysteine S-methyltransferase [Gammaproteobacteria bacterium]|nr:methylated-DNA--[protein]-cysteine S-methyltransferase [Gammaproteobacteria bacterium]